MGLSIKQLLTCLWRGCRRQSCTFINIGHLLSLVRFGIQTRDKCQSYTSCQWGPSVSNTYKNHVQGLQSPALSLSVINIGHIYSVRWGLVSNHRIKVSHKPAGSEFHQWVIQTRIQCRVYHHQQGLEGCSVAESHLVTSIWIIYSVRSGFVPNNLIDISHRPAGSEVHQLVIHTRIQCRDYHQQQGLEGCSVGGSHLVT